MVRDLYWGYCDVASTNWSLADALTFQQCQLVGRASKFNPGGRMANVRYWSSLIDYGTPFVREWELGNKKKTELF